MRSSPKPSASGFTLVELLVVIAIITLLYTVVFGSISNSKSRSRDDKRVSDVKEIQLALAQFFDACGAYPATITTGATCAGTTDVLGDFIKTIPTDPKDGTGYRYFSPAPGKSTTSFCLGATMETKDVSDRADNAGCDTTVCVGPLCFSVKGP